MQFIEQSGNSYVVTCKNNQFGFINVKVKAYTAEDAKFQTELGLKNEDSGYEFDCYRKDSNWTVLSVRPDNISKTI